MKPIDILITNRNSLEAVQLCVESARHYTGGYNHQVIVYDDASDNGIDLPYLRDAQERGWIQLIEGRERLRHGGGLNVLLNEICRAKYAVILDCDIEILKLGWLADLVKLIDGNEKAIGAVNCRDWQIRGPGHYLAPFCEFWFAVLNMDAYRDGMMVDWQPSFYADEDEIRKLNSSLPVGEIEQYIFDVGSKLYHKVLTDNPKGYYFITPLPEEIMSSFRHYRQVSHNIGDWHEHIIKHINEKLAEIRARLDRIRKPI